MLTKSYLNVQASLAVNVIYAQNAVIHTQKKMADRNVYKIFGVFLDVRL
jgi:hypothetical protein